MNCKHFLPENGGNVLVNHAEREFEMKKNYFRSFISALRSVCGGVKDSDDIYSHECTSWMVFDDLTKNNTFLVHKNRDAGARAILPMKSPDGAPRKWIGLGDIAPEQQPDPENLCMGINASGLIAIVNSGEQDVEPSDPDAKIETPAITKICLAECDTAAQAVEKLEEIRAARQYAHGEKGSTFLFMDLKEGFIVEMTAERCSVLRHDHGYALRANIWHNQDIALYSDNSAKSWLDSCNREYLVIRGLNRAWRDHGKLTVADMLEISREAVSPEDSPMPRALCFKSTNSSSTLELNLDYPDVLSTGYYLIGPLRHTVLVPVPMCVEKFHPKMVDLTWSSTAWKRFEELGFGAEVPAEWLAFEKDMLKEYSAALAQAESLLKSGKRSEAVALLNDTSYAIWEAAANLMQL